MNDQHTGQDALLSLVVPVYNEELAIGPFLKRIDETLQACTMKLEILFVNDGSSDNTLACLIGAQSNDARIRIVDLSRNFGKEAALSAGLAHARGAAVVPMDVDLQDPPELILEMIARWREGHDVVLARRVDRQSDSAAKRLFAALFYRLHNWVSNERIPENVGDFRLMDRRVVDALQLLPESRRFMKGLFAWVGFRSITIDYVRPERSVGTSKFNGWKLWNFALEGITSFSTAPLRFWTYMGLAIALLAAFFAVFIVLRVFFYGISVPGYASIMVMVALLGGVQLVGIGVIGEYLGRTYIESKGRPIFLVRELYEAKADAE